MPKVQPLPLQEETKPANQTNKKNPTNQKSTLKGMLYFKLNVFNLMPKIGQTATKSTSLH